jgi:hypothetical protein
MRPVALSLLLATTVGLGAACGAPPEPATGSAAEAKGLVSKGGGSPRAWKGLASKAQKAAFMKESVSPRMARVFQARDATRYADFGCKTCHGRTFSAPQEVLPRLVAKDGRISAPDKPELAQFMTEKVLPEMASALGMDSHDEFGCGGCHAIDAK